MPGYDPETGLPTNEQLAQIARDVDAMGLPAAMCDGEWNLVWVSEECKVLLDADSDQLRLGSHVLEAYLSEAWAGSITPASRMKLFLEFLPIMFEDTPGGSERIAEILDASMDDIQRRSSEVGGDHLRDIGFEIGPETTGAEIVALFEPAEVPEVIATDLEFVQKDMPPTRVVEVDLRLRDADNRPMGSLMLYGPGLPARVLTYVARGDEGMYSRMAGLVEPGRRSAAILFADMQASASLSRKLPSATYFRLVQGLTTAMDGIIVDRKGIVGKHAGDGVTAFFVEADLGSPSAAARAAISAARQISKEATRVAKEVGEETGLIEAADCQINCGIHWGGTLYMGQLVTGGRLEVTALGDEVNEAARVQQAACDGDILASKSLVERLSDNDASALGIDPDAVLYRTLSQIDSAPDKSVRDAGALPVTTLRELAGK